MPFLHTNAAFITGNTVIPPTLCARPWLDDIRRGGRGVECCWGPCDQSISKKEASHCVILSESEGSGSPARDPSLSLRACPRAKRRDAKNLCHQRIETSY